MNAKPGTSITIHNLGASANPDGSHLRIATIRANSAEGGRYINTEVGDKLIIPEVVDGKTIQHSVRVTEIERFEDGSVQIEIETMS